jgi:hypothetical protein
VAERQAALQESLRSTEEQLVVAREQAEYHARDAAALREKVKKLEGKVATHKEVHA